MAHTGHPQKIQNMSPKQHLQKDHFYRKKIVELLNLNSLKKMINPQRENLPWPRKLIQWKIVQIRWSCCTRGPKGVVPSIKLTDGENYSAEWMKMSDGRDEDECWKCGWGVLEVWIRIRTRRVNEEWGWIRMSWSVYKDENDDDCSLIITNIAIH